MLGILEKIWNEYLAEECATMEDEEEKALAKRAVAMGKAWREMLSDEARDAVEKYIDLLCELQDALVKRAFRQGCEFTANFFLEIFSL